MRLIETHIQLDALIGETYIYAIIIAIAALVLAFVIANLIKYGGGKSDTSHLKRHVWYIIVGILTPIEFFLFNTIYVSGLMVIKKNVNYTRHFCDL